MIDRYVFGQRFASDAWRPSSNQGDVKSPVGYQSERFHSMGVFDWRTRCVVKDCFQNWHRLAFAGLMEVKPMLSCSFA